MKLSSKIAIAVVAVVFAILHILLLTAEIIANFASVKPEIEKNISEALEMDCKIEGLINIRFLPMVSLEANDLTVGINTGF